MAERIPNRTRSALILLLITVIVVLVTLVADLMARIYLISMGQNEAEGFRGVEVFLMTCGFDALAMYIIYILLVVGISILFSARHAYGGLHARKIITSFVLTLIAPVVWFMFSFIFGIFMLRSFGIGPTMIIILFLIIIFLSTYELNGKRMGIFGLVIGILFALPLLALTNTVIQLGDKSEGLKHLASVFLVADIGLISSMTFFIISITKAMGYVSARPPRQDNLQLRLLNQQAQQLKMEVDILKMQKEQMALLHDIKDNTITMEVTPLIETEKSVEFDVADDQAEE